MTTSTAARAAAELREAALEVAQLAARRRDGHGTASARDPASLAGAIEDDAARPPADETRKPADICEPLTR